MNTITKSSLSSLPSFVDLVVSIAPGTRSWSPNSSSFLFRAAQLSLSASHGRSEQAVVHNQMQVLNDSALVYRPWLGFPAVCAADPIILLHNYLSFSEICRNSEDGAWQMPQSSSSIAPEKFRHFWKIEDCFFMHPRFTRKAVRTVYRLSFFAVFRS